MSKLYATLSKLTAMGNPDPMRSNHFLVARLVVVAFPYVRSQADGI